MGYKRNICRVKVFVAKYGASNQGQFILLDDYYTDDWDKIPKMGNLIQIDDHYNSMHQVLCSYIEYELDKLTKRNGVIPVYNILIGCEDNGESLKLDYGICGNITPPFIDLLTNEVWELLNTKRLNTKNE